MLYCEDTNCTQYGKALNENGVCSGRRIDEGDFRKIVLKFAESRGFKIEVGKISMLNPYHNEEGDN